MQAAGLAAFDQIVATLKVSWSNSDSPSTANEIDRPFDYAVVVTFFFFLMIVIDLLIAQWFGKERYYALHVVVNLIVIVNCFDDMLLSWRDPINSNACLIEGQKCASMIPLLISTALHVYHPLAFKTNRMDWIHHIPAYLVQFTTLCFLWGGNINFGHFAVMGLPGMLDYAFLVALGQGLLSRQTYKGYCGSINLWLRCPIAIASGFLGTLSLGHQWEGISTPQVIHSAPSRITPFDVLTPHHTPLLPLHTTLPCY
jgi:hypothetical protein